MKKRLFCVFMTISAVCLCVLTAVACGGDNAVLRVPALPDADISASRPDPSASGGGTSGPQAGPSDSGTDPEILYTVTFAPGDHAASEAVPSPVSGESGVTVPLGTLKPSKGYAFSGWSDGAELFTQNYTISDSDVTLTAQYSALLYHVYYEENKPNAAGFVTEMPADNGTQTVSLDAPRIGLPGAPRLGGYEFVGWQLGEAVAKDVLTFTEADVPEAGEKIFVRAVWREQPEEPGELFTVRYELGDHAENGAALARGQDVVPSGNAVTLPEVPAGAPGYQFAGWYKKGGALVSQTGGLYTVEGDVTLVATYAPILYDVLFSADDVKDVRGIPERDTISMEAPLKLPADPTSDNYDFCGWTGKGISVPVKNENDTLVLTEEMLPADGTEIVLTATWRELFTVRYELGEHAEKGAALARGQDVVPDGGAVTLPEVPAAAPGYEFDGWYKKGGALVSQTGGQYTVEDNVTLVATYKPVLYDILFSAGDAKDARGIPERDKISMEQPLKLPADPACDDYDFCGWTGKGIEDAVYHSDQTLALTEAMLPDRGTEILLTATWRAAVFTVKVYRDKSLGELLVAFSVAKEEKIASAELFRNLKVEKEQYTHSGWKIGVPGGGDVELTDGIGAGKRYADGDYIITVYAVWVLDASVRTGRLSAEAFTDDTPLYFYPEPLKAGEKLTLTAEGIRFTAASALGRAVFSGIHFYLTDSAPGASPMKNYIGLLYNDTVAGNAEDLGVSVRTESIGFPETPFLWRESLQELILNGEGVTLEASLDFTSPDRIVIEYELAATFTPWVEDEEAGQAVQFEFELWCGFQVRYLITAAEGALADAYTVALGGERAEAGDVALKRSAQAAAFLPVMAETEKSAGTAALPECGAKRKRDGTV